MITIQRKFSQKFSRNNLFLFLGFLILMALIGVLSSLIPMEIWNEPINEEIFGRSFAFYHLFPIGLFIFFLSFAIWISKKRSFTHPSVFLPKNEQEIFQIKYNQDKSLPVITNKRFGLVIILFFLVTATAIGLPHILNLPVSEKALEIWSVVILGLAVSGYIGYLVKYTKGYDQHALQVFEGMSRRLNDTHIQMEANAQNPSYGSRPLGKVIKGRYRGHEFQLDFYTFNPAMLRNALASKSMGGPMAMPTYSLSYKTKFKLNKLPFINFALSEKNETWDKIEGNTIDEVFNQRFELKGVNSGQLSEKLKTLLVECQRNLNLEFKKDTLIYKAESKDVLPYYTIEGVMLFLDFMKEIADMLESSEFNEK